LLLRPPRGNNNNNKNNADTEEEREIISTEPLTAAQAAASAAAVDESQSSFMSGDVRGERHTDWGGRIRSERRERGERNGEIMRNKCIEVNTITMCIGQPV
jgi:hypothetical protein